MRKAAALAALQVGALLGLAAYHEHVRAHAPTFRIPLQPGDPYDVLRGRYFILNPVDRRIKTGRPDAHLAGEAVERFLGAARGYEGPLLVGFCPVGDVHRVCDLRPTSEGPASSEGRLWARARAVLAWEATTFERGEQVAEPGWRVSLDLGLDRFFLPDRYTLPGRESDPGWELEVSHRPGLPLLPRRLWFRDKPLRIEG